MAKADEPVTCRKQTREETQAEAEKITCTMCGKTFDEWDFCHGDNRFDLFMSYGSGYDSLRLKFDFCISCLDKVLDTLIPMCKNDPIVDDDWTIHCIDGDGFIHPEWSPDTTQETKENKSRRDTSC